MYEQFVDK